MTARELIKELKKIGEMDLPVCIEDSSGYDEVMHVRESNFCGVHLVVISD